MLAVVVGAASPVLFGLVEPFIPYPVWAGLFVAMLAAVAISMMGSPGRIWPSLVFGSGVVASWALLLTTIGSAGFLAIIVVVLAAVSVYLVPRAMTIVIIAGNTVVLAIASYLSARDTTEVILVTGLYLLLQIGTALSSIAILREQQMRKRLSEANIELQASGVLLEESTRTAERLRISRDLHDSIGHQLTVLNLELEAARHSDDEAARTHVERATATAREVLGDLRATVGEMRDEPRDLVGALEGVVDGIPGLDVSVSVDPQLRVGGEAQEVLVRAVQEIATNTMRHADARELRIAVRRADDGSVRLEAQDDGRGAAHPVPGNGLRGMIERFDTLGGEVEIDGSHGFTVSARVPAA